MPTASARPGGFVARWIGRVARGTRTSTAVACIVVCIAYSVAGATGVWFLQRVLTPDLAGLSTTLGVPWLAAGLGVAGLMLYGTRAWPGVFAGSCITWGLFQGDSWVMVLLGAASESASIVLIVWLLRVWRYRPTLERYQDVLLLIAATAIGRTLTSGTDVIGLIATVWLHQGPGSPLILDEAGVDRSHDLIVLSPALLTYALHWWANTVAGIVLVVPLLAFPRPPAERDRSGTLAEPAAWALAAVAWLVVALAYPGPEPRLALLAGAFLLVAWAALRLGVAVASTGTLIFSMATTAGFGLQLGAFAGNAGRESIEIQWAFIGLLIAVGLFLTALLSGRERARRQLAVVAERYRRLFLANPIPMWAEEIATGRILLVNDAAVRAYGYPETAFLRLSRRDLEGAAASAEAGEVADGRDTVRPVPATHRTASGKPLEVEISSVRLELDGVPVRKCFVNVVDERNDLRLAVLNAADLERRRLGAEIRERLGAVLAELSSSVATLVRSTERSAPIERDLIAGLERKAASATTMCRQLTRGASPIEFARGDLLEALRGLPDVLAVDGGPELEISVRSFAPVLLSVERAEHVYRIAQDAVRAALVRPGVRRVHLNIDVTASAIEVSVEDDGSEVPAGRLTDTAEVSPIAVRSAAAHAQVHVEPGRAGGTRVRFECAQTLSAPAPTAAIHAASLDSPHAEEAPAPAASGARAARAGTWRGGLALFGAYVLTGAAGLLVLRHIDAERISFLPRLAFPWLANGAAVAGLMLGGARLAPAVLLGSVAVWGGLVRDPWITVLADAVGEMLCAVVVVRLLMRWKVEWTFDRARDLGLLVAAAAVGRAIPLVFDMLGLHLAIAVAPGSLTPAMRAGLATAGDGFLGVSWAEVAVGLRWWVNGVAGIALLVPVAVPLSLDGRRLLRERWPEMALLGLALAIAVAAVTAGPASGWRLPLLAFGVVLVAWAGVRFGVALAAAATLALSLGATVGYGLGLGPFAPTSAEEGGEVLWGFIGLLFATGLFIATTVVTYDRTVRELKARMARYEALFEAIPQPVFAYSRTTGRIDAVNGEAIRTYGYARAELLGMHHAELGADPASAAVAADRQKATVHRARSGRRFEVELAETAIDIDGETEILCFATDVTERNDLRRRVLEASDLERRRLAQDLHDGLGQTLTGLALGLASLQRDLERLGNPTAKILTFVSNAVEQAKSDCEVILDGLSPLDATAGDLVAALRHLPDRLPPESRETLAVKISTDAPLTLPLAKREHLFQVAREAVNNALKHSRASRIAVSLDVSRSAVTLVVADNGIGIDPSGRPSGGLGLQSLALRAEALRARLAVARGNGGGTVVTCRCLQTAA